MTLLTLSNHDLADQYLVAAGHIDPFARQKIAGSIRHCQTTLSELVSEPGSLVKAKVKTPGIGAKTRELIELIILHGAAKAAQMLQEEKLQAYERRRDLNIPNGISLEGTLSGEGYL